MEEAAKAAAVARTASAAAPRLARAWTGNVKAVTPLLIDAAERRMRTRSHCAGASPRDEALRGNCGVTCKPASIPPAAGQNVTRSAGRTSICRDESAGSAFASLRPSATPPRLPVAAHAEGRYYGAGSAVVSLRMAMALSATDNVPLALMSFRKFAAVTSCASCALICATSESVTTRFPLMSPAR